MAKALGKEALCSGVQWLEGLEEEPPHLAQHLRLTAPRPCQGPGLPRAPALVATSGGSAMQD